MTALLVSHWFSTDYGARVAGAAARAELLALPADPAARLPDSECARAEVAFFSSDIFPEHSRQFFSAARNFPHWLAARQRRAWDPVRFGNLPRDLRGQTALILGLGRIGGGIARLARLLGLYVVGVRRGARGPDDPVDELHPPQALPGLLARADWLIISCPLTPETRGLVDAGLIARLPKGARIINVARGEIVREDALIAALKNGHLGGAYLDVFETEPLPPDSPLWELPNVLVSPHNSAAASGNDERVLEIFLDNLGRWQRGEALVNEIQKQ